MAEYPSASCHESVVMKRKEAVAMTSATAAITKRAGTFSTILPQTMLPTPTKAALKLIPNPAVTALRPWS